LTLLNVPSSNIHCFSLNGNFLYLLIIELLDDLLVLSFSIQNPPHDCVYLKGRIYISLLINLFNLWPNFVITLIYGNFLANTIKLNTRHESGLNIHSLVKEWHRSLFLHIDVASITWRNSYFFFVFLRKTKYLVQAFLKKWWVESDFLKSAKPPPFITAQSFRLSL
jgi:hypothetical protein